MKKFLALLLALAMAFALVACGGGDDKPSSSLTTSNPPASSSGESSGDGGVVECEPLTFTVNCTSYETDINGVQLLYMIDRISELSGGAITVNPAWGGTLYDMNNQFDAVREGAVEMIMLMQMTCLDYIPLMGLPNTPPVSNGQEALDYLETLLFEDPETSAYYAAECEAMGIKYLGVMTTGENCFAASFDWSTIDELVAGSASFGAMATAKYEALGLTCASYAGPQAYDAFSRGLIDAANYTVVGAHALSWYEVAPYIVTDTLWSAGNNITVNAAWWDSLTDTQRAVIQQAVDETSAFAAEYCDSVMEETKAKLVEAGATVRTLNEEDSARWWAATFDASAADSLARVAGTEKEAQMIAILEKAAELTGYDWSYEG